MVGWVSEYNPVERCEDRGVQIHSYIFPRNYILRIYNVSASRVKYSWASWRNIHTHTHMIVHCAWC